MALTVDKLTNDERFCGDNVLQFLLYLPFGLLLMCVRIVLALVLWIASIVMHNKAGARHVLSTLACWTFGVYVKVKGVRDPRCSILIANYVSCLDSLAATHKLGSISLRKWKVPPFFASALGIKSASQFVRKQHFSETSSKPVLLQPEGGPTNGKGLLKFTDWPFPIGNWVQPVAISVERPFTNVTVHRLVEKADAFPWRDALWFLMTPCSAYTIHLLPSIERTDDGFVDKMRTAIAEALQVESTEYSWQQLCARRGRVARVTSRPPPEAARVKEVLPAVPLKDIIRELEKTRSVDATITNFLEGLVPYTPEPAAVAEPQPSTSQAPPKYITPVPTGVFPRSAKERQMSFQERKAHMIAEARKTYLDKRGSDAETAC